MKALKTVYLSLGSNLADKILNLQQAVFSIHNSLGAITKISPVYETRSWGFKADNFLNICLELETDIPPQKLLKKLLLIEYEIGRIRSSEEGYQTRLIDIDILYYGIEKTLYRLYKDKISLFAATNFIAIEGNIGAGKTTLAKKIAADFNGKLILERFADNPFLPKFYEDQQRYAFPLEMSFLADRYQQFTDDTSQYDLFKDFMVSDYDIYKSLIFAKVTLQKEEFELYRKLFQLMYREVKKPKVYVYLYQNTDRLIENIKKRGRSYEQNITPEYLNKINAGYFNFIKSYPEQNSLIIDLGEKDFVSNSKDYESIINQIVKFVLGLSF